MGLISENPLKLAKDQHSIYVKIGPTLPTVPVIPVVTPQPLSSNPEMDHKTRIAQLTAQIQARLANRPNFDVTMGTDG